MFGRTKTPQNEPAATPAAEPARATGGKGRPTPTRREAEARNKRTIGGAAGGLGPDATKAERKAARSAERERYAMERAKLREAMLTGDEKHYGPRDAGPARRFARDYVDARWNLGEFMLPVSLVVLALLVVQQWMPQLAIGAMVLLYGSVAATAVDAVLLRRRVGRLVRDKFGAAAADGIPGYAMSRSLQMRRSRMPRAMVKRGEFPR